MTFDLAIWKAEHPPSDDVAAREYEARMDEMEREQAPPSESIKAFVQELTTRFPEIDQPEGEDSPWAGSPLLGDASADTIYITMTWSGGPMARDWVASVAARHGLVCYDPQEGAVIRA